MIFRLTKITEGLVEGKPAFASTYALENGVVENNEIIASVIEIVTKQRPQELQIGKRYRLTMEVVPKLKRQK